MAKKSLSSTTDPTSDSHVHTRLCGHASGEMEAYVTAAVARGLTEIVFLEHLEEGIISSRKTWLSEVDFDYYFAEGNCLKEKYADDINIGLGVECGFNAECTDKILARLKGRDWDQVGISCHFLKLDGLPEHLNLFSRNPDTLEVAKRHNPQQLLERYLISLNEAVRILPGTKVCHLDGALRYLPELTCSDRHLSLIDTLLQTMQAKGTRLEINTSGLTIRNQQFPSQTILTMASRYGIEFVYGSDAHRPEDVGRYFDTINDLLVD